MISKSIIRYKTKSGSKKNSELRDSPSYRNSQLIGILFCVEDIEKHQSVKHLIKTFEHDNKKVQVLTYLPKDKDNYEFLFDFYSKKDFTFLGNFENEAITSFVEKPFDFLFCLDMDINIFNKYILAKSKAKCRIGNYKTENTSVLEMMISPKSQKIDSLVEEIIHYTKNLI